VDADKGRTRGTPKQVAGGGINDWPSLTFVGSRLAYVSTRYGQGQAGFGGIYSIVVREFASGREAAIPVLATPLLSPDGRRMAYAKGGIYITSVASLDQIGDPQLACADCGRPCGFSPDGSKLIHRTAGGLGLLDLTTGEKMSLVEARSTITEARISPDHRWIVFQETAAGVSRIWLARFGTSPIPRSEWHPLTDGSGWDDRPRWSPDSNLLYFLSDRDGFRCIWAQRLDSVTKHPAGSPFAVYHSHESRCSLLSVNPVYAGLEVARDMLVFVNGQTAGNVWLAHLAGN
jgi:Tol biopolymer transport system component